MIAAERQIIHVYQQFYLLRFFYILRLYQIHKALRQRNSLEKEVGTATGLFSEIAPIEKDPTGHEAELKSPPIELRSDGSVSSANTENSIPAATNGSYGNLNVSSPPGNLNQMSGQEWDENAKVVVEDAIRSIKPEQRRIVKAADGKFSKSFTVISNAPIVILPLGQDGAYRLPLPLSTHRYMSRFGPRTPFHNGTDQKAEKGTPIVALEDGEAYVNYAKGQGRGAEIWMLHGNGLETFYSHMSESWVPQGRKARIQVKKGQVIGLSGDTGTLLSGPHLHFGIYDAKKADFMNVEKYNWTEKKYYGKFRNEY